MTPDTKYLKEISRALASIISIQTQSLQPASQNQFGWLKKVNLVFLAALFLASLYFFSRLIRTTDSDDSILSNDQVTLGIDSLIKQVQDDLSKAEQERRENHRAPMFELKGFELEISFIVKRTRTQTGTIEYKAIAIDNHIEIGTEQTHKLKLMMDITPDEGSTEPSSSRPPQEGQVLGPVPLKKGGKR